MQNILSFLHVIHHMKRIERFKDMPFWKDTKIKRWDSNAEHSYRMAIMAILLIPHLDKDYDLEKTLKIILIHDLVEIIIDDKFPFKKSGNKYELPKNYTPDKPEDEILALKKLLTDLPKPEQEEWLGLFEEFVAAETGRESSNEAKLATALDRIEASLQVADYIQLNEFEITEEHRDLQDKYLKSNSKIGERKLKELVELISSEIK